MVEPTQGPDPNHVPIYTPAWPITENSEPRWLVTSRNLRLIISLFELGYRAVHGTLSRRLIVQSLAFNFLRLHQNRVFAAFNPDTRYRRPCASRCTLTIACRREILLNKQLCDEIALDCFSLGIYKSISIYKHSNLDTNHHGIIQSVFLIFLS
jgi:hypothetical protein